MPEAAPLDHNAPDDPLEILRDNLTEANRDLLIRTKELLESCARMPDEVSDDAMAGRFADQIKLLKAAKKTGEDRRKTAKEPHLAAGRGVDSFFKIKITEPLDQAALRAAKPLTLYERAKADAERRRREEEARAQAEAERKAREAAEFAAKAAQDDADLDAAIEAEEEAARLAQDAEAAKRAADASNAEMSRNRGEHGAVASLRTMWVGEVTDKDTLDLETLRPFLSPDCLQKAVNGFVRAGHRSLVGARIYEHTAAIVR